MDHRYTLRAILLVVTCSKIIPQKKCQPWLCWFKPVVSWTGSCAPAMSILMDPYFFARRSRPATNSTAKYKPPGASWLSWYQDSEFFEHVHSESHHTHQAILQRLVKTPSQEHGTVATFKERKLSKILLYANMCYSAGEEVKGRWDAQGSGARSISVLPDPYHSCSSLAFLIQNLSSCQTPFRRCFPPQNPIDVLRPATSYSALYNPDSR